MSKKIVLLSDGTGNAAGKVWRTNVWRIFQALDLKGAEQIAIYDDGVGTSSFKPLAILGGVFGWGLKRNVLDLYKFLCRNYKAGDEVYAFGFSRGSFTIRVVLGIVLNEGLVEFANEGELDKKARAAYRAYQYRRYSAWNLQFPYRVARYCLDKLFYTPLQRTVPSIAFVGLWDTVAAYGLPIDEMTRGVNQWIWPLELPNQEFDSRILKARHALSIDDERATFHPVLWNENPTNTITSGQSRPTGPEQLLQVWFAGVHSNVGGGYPDDSLANVSLAWMMAEAEQAQLRFKALPAADPDALLSADSSKDKDGRLYDSRAGLGGYYRYSPRKISEFYEAMPKTDNKGTPYPPPVPKIHESVFGRIKIGAHLYAPVGLPRAYEVVTTSDVLPNSSPPPPLASMATRIEPNNINLAEGNNAPKRKKSQEEIWDIIWRKRSIYFLTVFVTGYLLLYPLYRDSYQFQELRTPLRFVSDTIRLIGAVLPSLAYRWLDAYARDPAWFLIWASLVGFLTWISAKLAGSINDRMRLKWTHYLPNSNQPETPKTSTTISFLKTSLFILVILYLLCYPVLDYVPILNHLVLSGTNNDAMLAYTSSPVRIVLAAFLVFYFVPHWIIRILRQCALYKWLLTGFKERLAPAVSALVIFYLAIAFGSHYHFNIRDSFGSFCTPSPKKLSVDNNGFNDQGKMIAGKRPINFAPNVGNVPNDLCISTGVFLETNASYLVEVKRQPDEDTTGVGKWKFFGKYSYMGGQPISRLPALKSAVMAALFPFRRTFDRPWGNIILRIGSTGSEEDFLDRDPPKQPDDVSLKNADFDVPKTPEEMSEKLKPKRDGELFIYLNKPILGVWGSESLLSDWIGNSGTATVEVTKLPKNNS